MNKPNYAEVARSAHLRQMREQMYRDLKREKELDAQIRNAMIDNSDYMEHWVRDHLNQLDEQRLMEQLSTPDGVERYLESE